jgi:hypothetical protein
MGENILGGRFVNIKKPEKIVEIAFMPLLVGLLEEINIPLTNIHFLLTDF